MALRIRHLLTAGAAAAIALGPVLTWATPAAAATVAATIECGGTVQGPVSLNHDLRCDGVGITLLGGELDLRGHTISGDGSGIGISVAAPATGSTSAKVVNGSVTDFAVGIAGAGFGTVSLALGNVALSHHGTALDATSMSASLFHVRLKHNSGDAVLVSAPNTVSIHHSSIIDNGRGVDLVGDGRAEIDHTPISGNDTGIACSQGLVTLTRSTVSANTTGVELFQCEGSTFSRVRFLDNAQFGIDDTWGDTGIANPTLTVDRATFERNGVGLHLSTEVTAVEVVNSTFSRNGTGVLADSCAESCPITPVDSFAKNRFVANSGDGLHWGFGTVQVYANSFVHNGGWGFFAADGTTVIDNGRNLARHNRAGNCYRLACR